MTTIQYFPEDFKQVDKISYNEEFDEDDEDEIDDSEDDSEYDSDDDNENNDESENEDDEDDEDDDEDDEDDEIDNSENSNNNEKLKNKNEIEIDNKNIYVYHNSSCDIDLIKVHVIGWNANHPILDPNCKYENLHTVGYHFLIRNLLFPKHVHRIMLPLDASDTIQYLPKSLPNNITTLLCPYSDNEKSDEFFEKYPFLDSIEFYDKFKQEYCLKVVKYRNHEMKTIEYKNISPYRIYPDIKMYIHIQK